MELGGATHECTILAARPRSISEPLLDRIDIQIKVPRVAYEKLTDMRMGESSEKLRARVGPADVRVYCKLDEAGTSLMRTAMSQLPMSARGRHRKSMATADPDCLLMMWSA